MWTGRKHRINIGQQIPYNGGFITPVISMDVITWFGIKWLLPFRRKYQISSVLSYSKITVTVKCVQERIQDFKLGGGDIFGVFRVKNHDFTQKNHIFSKFRVPLDSPLVYLEIIFGTKKKWSF